MGWSGEFYKPHSIPKFFERQWTNIRADGSHLICLGQAFVGRFTLYGVWQFISADGTPKETFATVTLIRYGSKNDSCEWYYKDLEESEGPCERKCPVSLLKKLKTPAQNKYALEWRRDCWRYGLGLTRDGALKKARQIFRKDREKAIKILEDYNAKNPNDMIKYSIR